MQNMKLYRVKIQLKSPLVTPLKGDTIWGHYAWGIANHEGEEAVAKFIAECKSETPSLITSSAFPTGFICKRIPEIKERNPNGLSIDEYAKIKQEKKKKFSPASEFLTTNEGSNKNGGKAFEENITMHNSISRISGTVEDGSLFSTKELWAKTNDFDLYVLSTYESERVLQLSRWAFENGFGADSTIGKGVVKVNGIEEVSSKHNTKTYMALAPFVCDLNKVQNLRADIFIRSGKIGGAFASSLSPWKKTIVMYDEGAIFDCCEPIQFIGSVITNVHSDARIVHSGFAPVIPIE